MSRDLPSGFSDTLEDDVIYPFTAVELLFDGNNVVRLWTGAGTLNYDGNAWVGVGELLDVSAVEETSEISAKGATITLSGVPDSILSLALSEAYHGRVGKIYLGLTDPDTQTVSLTEVFSGFMDRMTIDEQAESSTIGLTLENKLVTLERPRTARYSHEFQRTLDSTDKGLEYVESIQLKEFVWGPNG